MRVLRCRAAYRDYVLDRIQTVLAEVERDVAMREDEDPRVQKWASVPKAQIDRRRTGTLTIVVGIEEPARAQLELEPRAEVKTA